MRSFTQLTVAGVVLCVLGLIAGCEGSEYSTPKGAAESLAAAMEKGDVEGVKRASAGGDPKAVEGMTKVVAAMKELNDAAVAKFGDQGKGIASNGPGGDLDMARKVREAEVKIEGDTVTLTVKGDDDPLKLKKVDGEWKVDLSEMAGPAAAMGAAMFDGMASAAKQTAADIKAGKYKTAEEAEAAFTAQMMGGLMEKMLPQDEKKE